MAATGSVQFSRLVNPPQNLWVPPIVQQCLDHAPAYKQDLDSLLFHLTTEPYWRPGLSDTRWKQISRAYGQLEARIGTLGREYLSQVRNVISSLPTSVGHPSIGFLERAINELKKQNDVVAQRISQLLIEGLIPKRPLKKPSSLQFVLKNKLNIIVTTAFLGLVVNQVPVLREFVGKIIVNTPKFLGNCCVVAGEGVGDFLSARNSFMNSLQGPFGFCGMVLTGLYSGYRLFLSSEENNNTSDEISEFLNRISTAACHYPERTFIGGFAFGAAAVMPLATRVFPEVGFRGRLIGFFDLDFNLSPFS